MAADGERHERVAQALNQVISMQVRKAPGATTWKRRRRILAHQEAAPASGCAQRLLASRPPPASALTRAVAHRHADVAAVTLQTCRSGERGGWSVAASARRSPAQRRGPFPAHSLAHTTYLTHTPPSVCAEPAEGENMLGAREEDCSQIPNRLTKTAARVKLLVRCRRSAMLSAPIGFPPLADTLPSPGGQLLAVAAVNARDDVETLGDTGRVTRALNTLFEAEGPASPADAHWRHPDRVHRGLSAAHATAAARAPSDILRARVRALRGGFKGAVAALGLADAARRRAVARQPAQLQSPSSEAPPHVRLPGGVDTEGGTSSPETGPVSESPERKQSASIVLRHPPPQLSEPVLRSKRTGVAGGDASPQAERCVSFASTVDSVDGGSSVDSGGLSLREGAIGRAAAPRAAVPRRLQWGSGERVRVPREPEVEEDEEDSAAPEWLLASAETAVRRAESAFLHDDAEGAEAAADELVCAATHRGDGGEAGRSASPLAQGGSSAPGVSAAAGGEEEALDSLEQLEQQLARRVSRARQGSSPETAASAAVGGIGDSGERDAGADGNGIATSALHRYMAPELADFVRNLRREVDEVLLPADEILEKRARARQRLTRSVRLVANAARATSPKHSGKAQHASEGPDRIARRMCFAWMRMLRKRHAGEGKSTPFGRGCVPRSSIPACLPASVTVLPNPPLYPQRCGRLQRARFCPQPRPPGPLRPAVAVGR